MKKFYKKIPLEIIEKVQNFTTDEFYVSVAKRICVDEFQSAHLAKYKFTIQDGLLAFESPFLPPKETGKYSRRNIEGYSIVNKNLPKVEKTYYLGERPKFGDWSKGSFSLYVTKLVFQREHFYPRETEILIEVINELEVDGKKYFTLKFTINDLLNRSSNGFNDKLLSNINLLQENVGAVDVYQADASNADYLRTLIVDWAIFPPGNRETDISRITGRLRNASPEVIQRIQERYDFLLQFNPINVIQGLNGMGRYFGMQFKDDLVVFENIYLGNAIYFLFEDWQATSKLSRSEIMALPESKFIRIRHSKFWKERLTQELNRLNPPNQNVA